jgi:urease accessory protein
MKRALRLERNGAWPRDRQRGTVTLAYDERHRRRVRLATDQGEAFLLDLPRAVVLDAGDGLALDDGSWIEVRPAAEKLIEIRAAHPELLARLAWHIGNRHVPAEIARDHIRLRADPVLADMLRGLGARVTAIEAPFTPERGAYDGGLHDHHHGDDHEH